MIQKAIRFAVQTHEIDQKQRRKGKDVPYIVHPMTVGLILASAGADEDVVVAGILHDTIEDSSPERAVSCEMIEKEFNKRVADLVLSVTETDKSLSWEERKKEALDHIEHFSHESVLVKSADIIANLTELIDDYKREKDAAFSHFKAGKEKTLENYTKVTQKLLSRWEESPLANELQNILDRLEKMT